MTSRKQLRVQRRQERLSRERAAAARRGRWIRFGAGGITAVVALFVLVIAIVGATGTGNAIGLATGQAPWPAESAHLRARLAGLAFPPTGDESYYIHALLHA